MGEKDRPAQLYRNECNIKKMDAHRYAQKPSLGLAYKRLHYRCFALGWDEREERVSLFFHAM